MGGAKPVVRLIFFCLCLAFFGCSGDGAGQEERKISNATETLEILTREEIGKENVEEILNDTIAALDENIQEIAVEDLVHIIRIVELGSAVKDMTVESAELVLDVINVINKNLPGNVLDNATDSIKVTTKLIQSLDNLGKNLKIEETFDETGVRQKDIIAGGIAIRVLDIQVADDKKEEGEEEDFEEEEFIGLQLLSQVGSSKSGPSSGPNLASVSKEGKMNTATVETAIMLPRKLLKEHMKGDDNQAKTVRVAINVYEDTTLFEKSERSDQNDKTLNSKVIAAEILINDEPIRKLHKHHVTTVFRPQQQPKSLHQVLECAFWKFDEFSGTSGWAKDGCQLEKTDEEGRVFCKCDHLTNFAVILSYKKQETLDNEHMVAQSIITIVGLSLSITGLALSVLSFLLVKKVRQGRPQQTLFNLCLALLLSWITFLAGINQTSSYAGCVTVAAILHYLVLASFMWMLMEAILQYLLFVRVRNSLFTNYMFKTAIPAWGIPLIPVIISLSVDTDLYRGGHLYCWMSLELLYYGFALPVGLILLTNAAIFVLVMVSLWRRKDMSKHSSQTESQTVVNIRASFVCFCVLGLSWIFGFLAIEDARVVFQYLFCLTASLQGFVIFAMMTARDRNIRQFWANCYSDLKTRTETSPLWTSLVDTVSTSRSRGSRSTGSQRSPYHPTRDTAAGTSFQEITSTDATAHESVVTPEGLTNKLGGITEEEATV